MLDIKETWYIVLEHEGKKGIGECGLLRGLSVDDLPDYATKLAWACNNISRGKDALWEELRDFPSIQFGIEMAFLSLESSDPMILFPSNFTKGQANIPINGLVWMGNEAFMLEQINEKIAHGYSCIKLKVGAIDFEKEVELLSIIRSNFDSKAIEIRVDANGGFSADDAMQKLHRLSKFDIHSIEQPIAKGQLGEMARLCRDSPIPVALDEELIGISHLTNRENLLDQIRPQYLIFKPSFIGGIRGTQQWIALCEKFGIAWWITSALESNIGLNAIAQWAYSLGVSMPQGLGTGALYTNNIASPLIVNNGYLQYSPDIPWGDWPE